MNRDSYPVVFQYDPFVGVYECFKELFPDKDAEIWWQYDLTDGEGGKVVPADFRVAALMLVDVLYSHRSPQEQVKLSDVGYTFEYYTKQYMKL